MKKIRIVSTPPGSAPQWVREGWVGVEIPYDQKDDLSGGIQCGADGGPAKNLGGYTVQAKAAFDSLAATAPVCFEWWEQAGFTNGSPDRLVFRRDVCDVIEIVEVVAHKRRLIRITRAPNESLEIHKDDPAKLATIQKLVGLTTIEIPPNYRDIAKPGFIAVDLSRCVEKMEGVPEVVRREWIRHDILFIIYIPLSCCEVLEG